MCNVSAESEQSWERRDNILFPLTAKRELPSSGKFLKYTRERLRDKETVKHRLSVFAPLLSPLFEQALGCWPCSPRHREPTARRDPPGVILPGSPARLQGGHNPKTPRPFGTTKVSCGPGLPSPRGSPSLAPARGRAPWAAGRRHPDTARLRPARGPGWC